MLEAKVVEPTAEDFPDPYDKSPESVENLFSRVCWYMGVNRGGLELEIFPDETAELREILPSWSGDGTRPSGLYLQAHEQEKANDDGDGRMVVAIRSTMLNDPMSLVATVAHELGHVILLGRELISPKTPDHEPLTDLVTVFLGLGVFTANSATRFMQFQDNRHIGWSTQRLGHLPSGFSAMRLQSLLSSMASTNPIGRGIFCPMSARISNGRSAGSKRTRITSPEWSPLASCPHTRWLRG